jgi:predicted nucleic acid-binding protein
LSAFVLDNSVTMRWCFEGTSTPYSEEVLEQLLTGHEAEVPVLWLYEVVAVLAKAQRTGAITMEKAHEFLEDLRSLDIAVDAEGDAAYLELAARRNLPLASLDDDLNRAAKAAGVLPFRP